MQYPAPWTLSPGATVAVQPQQAPEMLRVPLESVVMTVKAIFGATAPAAAVLGRALTPPEACACSCAVAALKVRPEAGARGHRAAAKGFVM